jgi:hypothetical protein
VNKKLGLLGWLVSAILILLSCSSPKDRLARAQKDFTQRVDAAPPIVPAVIYFDTFLKSNTGVPILSGEKVIAFKADGSTVILTKEHGRDPALTSIHRQIELDDGTVEDVSDHIKSFTRLVIPDARRARTILRLDTRLGCRIQVGGYDEGGSPVGTKSILGYETEGILVVKPDLRSTSWRSPQLNCAALSRTDDLLNANGTVAAQAEDVATKIKLGEPDPVLFTIPSEYQQLSFSEKFEREMRVAKVTTSGDTKKKFEHEDQFYEKYKQ